MLWCRWLSGDGKLARDCHAYSAALACLLSLYQYAFVDTTGQRARGAEGRPEAVVAVAPLLLLLHPDPILLPGLTPARRYAPPAAAAAAYLAFAAVSDLPLALSFSVFEAGLIVAALACSVPTAALVIVYLWRRRRQNEWWLLLAAPANLLPAVFSRSRPCVWLAAGALVGAGAQALAMRRKQAAGTRLI